MLDVDVIDDPAAAEASLDPIRSRLLAALTEPASAAALAARVGLPRQKVNYHLRTLEQHGLVELVEERKRGGLTERVLQATAASDVIPPAAPISEPADRGSARWLVALGGRLAASGAQAGIAVFLRGQLWDLGSSGPGLVVDRGGQRLAEDGPGARLINLWL